MAGNGWGEVVRSKQPDQLGRGTEIAMCSPVREGGNVAGHGTAFELVQIDVLDSPAGKEQLLELVCVVVVPDTECGQIEAVGLAAGALLELLHRRSPQLRKTGERFKGLWLGFPKGMTRGHIVGKWGSGRLLTST